MKVALKTDQIKPVHNISVNAVNNHRAIIKVRIQTLSEGNRREKLPSV